MFGLIQWCTLGHLVCLSDSSKDTGDVEQSKVLSLLSKLHFSILNSLQAYKSMELNQQLFHISHFVSLASELVRVYNLHRQEFGDEFQVLVERLGQVIQVAVVTGGLTITSGMVFYT